MNEFAPPIYKLTHSYYIIPWHLLYLYSRIDKRTKPNRSFVKIIWLLDIYYGEQKMMIDNDDRWTKSIDIKNGERERNIKKKISS